MPVKNKEYPKEHYIELVGLSPHIIGRLTLDKIGEKFSVEIDLILGESKKIYSHVGALYDRDEELDALNDAVGHLKKYLEKLKRRC